MKVLDWMGRDILVPCDESAVWKRVAEETNNREVVGWSFDAWTKVLSVSCDSGRGVSYTGYTGCDTFKIDISDLITGKMEVVSPGYKGEVNNEGLES